MEPNAILTIFAALVLLGIPVTSVIDTRRGAGLDAQDLEFRRAIYGSVAFSLLVMAGLTLAVVTWQDVDPGALGWAVSDTMRGFLWGAGVTVASLGIAWVVTSMLRAAGFREGPLTRLLMPRDAKETRAFLILSGVAAICEEYVYRGFLLWVGSGWLGSPWLGAVLVSVSFGFAHWPQRFAGMMRAGTLGFTLCIPVIMTGSLFPAIVAHFWINAAIGSGLWRVLLLPEEEPTETESAAGPEEDVEGKQEDADSEDEYLDRESDGGDGGHG
jgi:membrane protease YdiL (CAAX protease family)